MKPKLLLLSVCFIVFYLFTDFTWQVGRYFTEHKIYVLFQSKRGMIAEGAGLCTFLLDSVLGYLVFYKMVYQRQNKVLAIIVYLFLAVPLMIFCRYLIQEELVYTVWGFHNYSVDMLKPVRYFMDNIYFSIYYSAFGLVFFFIQFSSYHQKKQNELLLQSRNAELSFLRSQINPHFLFNSLNNVYTLVYQGSANALPSISKLSELLRYMLYEKADTVPLDKELQYLYNYIDLQLMRYNFSPAKQIDICVPPGNKLMIAPLTLIPFVENAFKHGDLKDAEHPLKIKLHIEDKQLNFLVSNKKSNFNKDETGGIGLDNVKKRLMLIYSDKHELSIIQTEDIFTVSLNIILNE